MTPYLLAVGIQQCIGLAIGVRRPRVLEECGHGHRFARVGRAGAELYAPLVKQWPDIGHRQRDDGVSENYVQSGIPVDIGKGGGGPGSVAELKIPAPDCG